MTVALKGRHLAAWRARLRVDCSVETTDDLKVALKADLTVVRWVARLGGCWAVHLACGSVDSTAVWSAQKRAVWRVARLAVTRAVQWAHYSAEYLVARWAMQTAELTAARLAMKTAEW